MIKDRYDYFVLAYESPNFSVAAAKVPISPQGLAKAIRALEKDLDVVLFEQDESGQRRPTVFADELYEFATHMQAERTLLFRQFDSMRESQRATIRVAASLGIIGMFGSSFVRRFERQHPNTDVHVVEMPDAVSDSGVLDGSYDIGLAIFPVSEGLASIPLYETSVELWVRDDNPLAARTSVGVEDLAGRRLAMPGDLFKCRTSLQASCERAGAEPPEFVDFSEIFWIYDFVQRGRGIGFTLPHLRSLPVFSADERVKAVPLRDARWSFGVSYLRGRNLCEREKQFVQHLKSKAATFARE